MKTELDAMILMGENILIKPDKAVEDGRTPAGIIVKKTGIEKTPKWGTVVKIAPDVDLVKVGDKILLWGITVGTIELDKTHYMMAIANKLLAYIPKR